MNDAGLLHNMSVPPRSTMMVRRSALPGQRYAIDARTLEGEGVEALRQHGAAAALALLESGGPSALAAALTCEPANGCAKDVEDTLAARFAQELESARVPNRVGVFVDFDAQLHVPHTTWVSMALGLALLARRSGPLYLPRRPFAPSLIVPARVALVFPDLA